MGSPKLGILSLQGAVSEQAAQLQKCGAEVVAVKRPADLDGVEGLVIPGGESTTIGLLMQQFGLDQYIRELYTTKKLALMGTCAGMVLLAKNIEDGKPAQPLLGLMDVRVKRNAFGRQKESFEADVQINGLPTPFTGVFIRAPVIIEAENTVEPLAKIDEGIIAARQGRILVTSFHPELTDDLSLHYCFINMCLNKMI